jgi:class 3 adenylate cyclase
MKIYFLLLIIPLITINGYSQDQQLIDSLLSVLKQAKPDTAKADILNNLCIAYEYNNPEKAIDYAQQTLALSEQLGYKSGIRNAHNGLGTVAVLNGDNLSALEHFKECLKISEEKKEKKKIASSYNNIGIVYDGMANYPEALKCLIASLKINEELDSKRGIIGCFNGIGSIYVHQANYPEALKNFFSGLKIAEEIEYKEGLSTINSNIAMVYTYQGNYPNALRYNFASLKIAEDLGNKYGLGVSYNNIGTVYYNTGNFTEALKYQFSALKIREELEDKEGIAGTCINIGHVYTKQKKFKEASQYLTRGLFLAKEVSSISLIMEGHIRFSALDSTLGNYKQALEHYKLSIIARDTLVNTENTKKITQQQMQYEIDKKESLTKAEQEKKEALAIKELQKQKLVRNGFVGGFAVVLLFAGVFFTQRNKIKKGKKRSDELLLNILPEEVAEELKAKGSADAKQIDDVTVLFTDFKGFTQLSEKLTPKELVAEINECFSAFDNIMQRQGVEKIKTIGDSYMAAGGLPTPNTTHAFDVVKSALDIQQYMQDHKARKEAAGELFFEIRIGVHTGPVVAGIVGVKKFAYDIWGDTVNTASRMESSGEADKVNISGTTYELVKDKFVCTHRGKIRAKNKGEVDMYFVESIIQIN